MDPAIVAAISGLVGAFIGALAGIVVSIVNNKYQLRQLQAQWAHEEKKAQIESEATKERQSKERLQEIYANAVSNLSEVIMFVKDGIPNSKEYVARLGEAQKWLSLVVVYYEGSKKSDFESFYNSYMASLQRTTDLYIRQSIYEDVLLSLPRMIRA